MKGVKTSPYTADLSAPVASPMLDKPPKLNLRKNPNGGAPLGMIPLQGMGDYAQEGEPYQKYWQILRANVKLPPQQAVIQAPVAMPAGPWGNPADAMTAMQTLAKAICDCMSCTMLQTKNPNWTEPPSESVMIDQTTTSAGIPIPAGAPGPSTEVLQIRIPDRFYGVISHIGNMLEDDAAFTGVEWQVFIGQKPAGFSQYLGGGVVSGGIFTAQLGDPSTPTRLAMPIIAKYGDSIRLFARSTDGAAHTAFGRFLGWMYPVNNIVQSGDPCSPTGIIPLWHDGFIPDGPPPITP